jgi:hypothetical protein
VTVGLSYDPAYFQLNVGNQLSFKPFALNTDARSLADYDLKAVTVPANTPYMIFTNHGACTIQSVRVDYTPLYPGSPMITFLTDTVSNGCEMLTLFSAQGNLAVPFHGDSIDVQTIGPAGGSTALGCQRQFAINCTNAASIYLTFTNNVTLWSDVLYRPGPAAVTNSWHVVEALQLTAPNSVLSVQSLSGKVGQLESIEMFALATNGQYYLESRPTVYLDTNRVLANGTEDFFGGSWYWNDGIQVYATPQWGSESENYVWTKNVSNNTYTDGNMSYRFFYGAFFTNSFLFNLTNVTTNYCFDDLLTTYWTIP